MDLAQIINASIVAILIADRPAGLPEEVDIQPAQSASPHTSPRLAVRCENTATPHPRLFSGDVIVSLHTRPDDSGFEDGAAWHAAVVEHLNLYPGSLYHTLLSQNLRLKRFTPGPFSDEPAGERGRLYSQTWRIHVESI